MRAQSTTIRVKERRPQRCALNVVVDALMYSLRSRGIKALQEPPTKRRLSQLSDAQVIEVGDRLQKLKPAIARAWTAEEVKALLQARG